MKLAVSTLLLLLLLVPVAASQTSQSGTATVTFTWDAKPSSQTWTHVRIYERKGTAIPFEYVRVAEVTGDQTMATITGVVPAERTYIARSVNIWESVDSEPVVLPPPPEPPKMKATVTVVTIQIP